MSTAEHQKLMQLLWDLVEGRLDASSAELLTETLERDASARTLYAEFLGFTSSMRTHYSLGDRASLLAGLQQGTASALLDERESGCRNPAELQPLAADYYGLPKRLWKTLTVPSVPGRRSSAPSLALASSILLVAAMFYGTFAILLVGLRPTVVSHEEPVDAPPPRPAVAFITDGSHAIWAKDGVAFDSRKSLRKGQVLELVEGHAEITFSGGAQIDLRAPATLTIESEGKALLDSGKLTATVPREAIGFAVQTPSMLVVDLGTVFCVEASRQKTDQVHVIKGEVELRFSVPGSHSQSRKSVHLFTGQALSVDQVELTASPIPVNAARFGAEPEWKPTIDLPIDEAYVAAVKASRPVAYWRFEEVINNQFVRNEMSRDCPAGLFGAVRIRGPWGYRRATFSTEDVMQYATVDTPLLGIREECSIELFVRPDTFLEGTLVSLIVPDPSAPNGANFVSLGALELMPANHKDFAGKAIRFLHRSPPGVKGGTSLISDGKYQTSRWQHIVATRSRSELNLYVNGVPFGSTSFEEEAVAVDPHIVIGRLYRDGDAGRTMLETRQLQGQMDELAIYGRELSAEEVRRHYMASGISNAGSEQ